MDADEILDETLSHGWFDRILYLCISGHVHEPSGVSWICDMKITMAWIGIMETTQELGRTSAWLMFSEK